MLGIKLQLAGAVVALIGHQFGVIPDLGPIEPHQLTVLVGLALALVGIVISRRD